MHPYGVDTRPQWRTGRKSRLGGAGSQLKATGERAGRSRLRGGAGYA